MIRTADVDDLTTITALTSKKRRQLADWEPEFWAMGENADEIHHAWLERLVASDRIVSRVALDERRWLGSPSAFLGRTGGLLMMFASPTTAGVMQVRCC